MSTLPNNPHSHGPVLLAQAGRDALTNYNFIVEAPWKACRLCGSVYQSHYDRRAYYYAKDGLEDAAAHYNKLGEQRRQRWLQLHNKREHPQYDNEVRLLEASGLPVTSVAAHRLSTYGIIPMGPTSYEDEIADALFSAPRAPNDDPGSETGVLGS